MRRLAIPTLLFPALVFLTGVLGCSETKKELPPPPPPAAKDGKAKGGKVVFVEATTDGVLKGRVVYDGTPPAKVEISDMLGHKDKDGCLAGTEKEKIKQTWLIDDKGGVANALVFLAPPAGKTFKVDPSMVTEKEVIVDQPHCAFIPHIFAVFTNYTDASGKDVPTGQVLKIKNSAPFNHNTKITADPTVNPGKNVTLTPKQEEVVSLKYQGLKPITIGCDFHNWMNAQGFTFKHPYFAVTKEDGTFEIKNAPTGVELNLVAWHEGPQFFHGGQKGTPITLQKGDNVQDLKVSAK